MTKTNPARGLPRKTKTAGLAKVNCENCGRSMTTSFAHALCPTCLYVAKVCAAEGVTELADLRDHSLPAVLWRVSDVLRRSGIEDAERLIRQLELYTT